MVPSFTIHPLAGTPTSPPWNGPKMYQIISAIRVQPYYAPEVRKANIQDGSPLKTAGMTTELFVDWLGTKGRVDYFASITLINLDLMYERFLRGAS